MKTKSRKTIVKRIKMTKTGKLLKRYGGQDHFNARESGNTTRKKRRDKTVSKAFARNIKMLMSGYKS
ncbi:MAG: 50S ribosomal protein L35 [bacterium]|nr:50S ribosomal protein L35 [bacterium]